MQKCEFHDEMTETVSALTSINNATLQWQAAEEVHRANIYKVLTGLQSSQSLIMKGLSDIQLEMHKEFATKEELKAVADKADKRFWMGIGLTFSAGAAMLALIQWLFSYITC